MRIAGRYDTDEMVKSIGGTILNDERDYINIIERYPMLSCTIDSRNVKNGDVFVPILGENTDGHCYILSAVKNGCRFFLTEKDIVQSGYDCEESEYILKNAVGIKVDSTIAALQDLARHVLKKAGVRVVAVTGSVGKTGTKDMVHAVLGTKYKAHKTQGNFNNHIGMPLTIVSMPEDTEILVLEMGMDKFGEIHTLVDISRPENAIITNIGDSHIENLGSRENILRAKLEITDYFDEENTLIVFTGNELLNQFIKKENSPKKRINYKILSCGEFKDDDFSILETFDKGIDGSSMTIKYGDEVETVDLKLPGLHNCYNAALALAMGSCYGISIKDGKKGLQELELTERRLNIIDAGRFKIIDDTYNASPDSMRAALKVLEKSESRCKIAVLGDMLELGEKSNDYHYEIGEMAAKIKDIKILTTGEFMKKFSCGAKNAGAGFVKHYEDRERLKEDLPEFIQDGALVLFKGSNGMHMNEFIDELIGERNNAV